MAAYQGWVNGATAVNPSVRTRKVYLNSFDDAAAGREAALALIRAGADMFHHNADAAGLGVFQAAKESPGVFVFGANGDQGTLAPERVPDSLQARVRAAADSLAAGTLIAAPRPKSMQAARRPGGQAVRGRV